MADTQWNPPMRPEKSQIPYWTVAWTHWGTRCSALVQGNRVLKALDGFTQIDVDDIANLLTRTPKAAG